MITLDRLVGAVLLLWVSLHTISYGYWTWKSKNKLGAVMVFALALSVLALPIYSVFFRY